MQLWGIYLSLLSLIVCTLCSLDSELDPCGPCPEHWVDGTLPGLGCLLFNSTTPYTWEGANSYCQEENATLLEIWTSLQSDFISSYLILLEDQSLDSHWWWTCGTDIGREGEWYWASSGASVGDFVWAPSYDEPNGGTAFNCMVLSDGSWEHKGNSESCTASYWPICQKK